eukprot:7761927-Pyramimonas_sp.AAC.1
MWTHPSPNITRQPQWCGYVPGHHRTNPSPDNCHPTCDPTAAERPITPPIDFPLYPDYPAQVAGTLAWERSRTIRMCGRQPTTSISVS